MAVTCIGGAHVDVALHLHGPVVSGTSNPGRASRSTGGVASNVARTLGKLGIPVALASQLGDDPEGEAVAAAAAGDGVDLSAVGRSTLHPTATYTAVLGPDGELVVGIAATEIYDTLDDLWAQMALRRARRSAVVVIDANLPETVIDAIVGGLPETTLLAADPVSVPKAARLRPVLDRLDVLFAGVDEAAELAGAGGDAHELAGRLAGSGPRAVVVTDSARGAVLADAGGVARHPAVPSSVVDVTGAGDALVAGFLFAVLGGEARPIGWGLAAAGLAVESPTPVPDRLDAATLAARVGGGGAEGVRL